MTPYTLILLLALQCQASSSGGVSEWFDPPSHRIASMAGAPLLLLLLLVVVGWLALL